MADETSFAAPIPRPLSLAQVLDAAVATMNAARYCFLVTVDASGHPQARMVFAYGLGHDPDMTLRIATNATTRKVREITRDGRATLAYADLSGEGYVTLLGEARLVRDLEERRRWWDEGLRAFFPDGPEGEDYLLIEFRPRRIEMMSFAHKVADEPLGWQPAVLEWDSGQWVLRPTVPRA